MAVVRAAPNIERRGVIAGCVLRPGVFMYLMISRGLLFARGVMYRPAERSLGVLLGGQSWIYYGGGGYYSRTSMSPDDPEDAFIGWAIADSIRVVAVSCQEIQVPAPDDNVTVIPLGAVIGAGPGSRTYGDTGVAGMPGYGTWVRGDGTIEISSLSVPLGNDQSIQTATFRIYYQDETAAAVSALTADVDAATETIPVVSSVGFTVGNSYLIDQEVVRVDGKNEDNLAVTRGHKGTTAAAHWGPKSITGATNATPVVVTCTGHGRAAGQVAQVSGVGGNTAANGKWLAANPAASTLELAGSSGNGAYTSGGTLAASQVYAIEQHMATFVFEPQTFIPVPPEENFSWIPDWVGPVLLPTVQIAAIDAWVVNAFGPSAMFAGTYITVNPLRTLHGGQVTLEVDGVLGVQSDAVPEFTMPYAAAPDVVFANVTEAPTGAPLRMTVKVDGADYAKLTIAAGGVSSVAQSGYALGAIAEGAKIGLDITAVGSTFPGERLVVVVKL
jgi:hypothetical protein